MKATASKTVPRATPPHAFEAYSHVVSPLSAEDGGGFVFAMPDFPGLLADGPSVDAAVADGREAFLALISAMVDMGRSVPAPTLMASDFSSANASGKFVTRVPRSLHQRLTTRARAEGVSLNALVMVLIAEGLGRREERA
ncbi:toxin-antitoxin system HicB family antitoxin [Roseateles sp.]|uniref:toxin-antitoxin system HicB family antitoxin n=1 Tax=Roseateles sp. TaxID=1971397 RepID=UPI00286ACB86|nr:toxin-antitoxin system HicB family antitoxin [Roseateles sp.]